ncbi:unnamed protein product [Cylicostephanus goldi]|uniref:Uncharacterized protein n=1 Tax=Cylicostephanus goldi TaxID=71465 RepID=A0A3P7LSF9_CYLGO|nr:unnamed protein product [Cylicostephanus goldi]
MANLRGGFILSKSFLILMEGSNDDEVTLIYIILSLFVNILLLLASFYQLRALYKMKKRKDLAKINKAVEKAKKALRCARWSAVEIAVLAAQAGMTLNDIREEYAKDASDRQEVLTSVLGSGKNNFVKKFLHNYPSRFLKSGYKLEQDFIKLAEENIRTAINNSLMKIEPK